MANELLYHEKFGENLGIPSAVSESSPQDIVDEGGAYVPPTGDDAHTVESTSNEDKGVLIGTYSSTTYNQSQFIDNGADFITDGVAIGHVLMNDSTQDHTVVLNIVDLHTLDIEPWHHTDETNVGDTFRIAGLSSGKTGAIVAHIKIGWSKSGEHLKEFIILNGTTPVNCTNSYYRSSTGHTHGSGTNKNNVGDIILKDTVTGTNTWRIKANKGRTLMAFDHVPFGYLGYIHNYYGNTYSSTLMVGRQAKIYLMTRLWGNQKDGEIVEHSMGIGDGTPSKDFEPYKPISSGTDIWIRCTGVNSGDNLTDIQAGFDLEIEKI